MDKVSVGMAQTQSAPEISGPTEEHEVQPQYLTYRQAETMTGLSRVTLWRLIGAGEVRASRIGRAVRIHRYSLVDFMERESNVG